MSLRGVKKITLLVIASPEGAKQSHKKRLRLPRRSASRNDNLLYEIAALPAVVRNDRCAWKCNFLYHVNLGKLLKIIHLKGAY
jgi:hypothetical protein